MRIQQFATFAGLLMIVGCGGGSEGTGAFSTGFSKNAQVASLTEQDRQELCQKISDYEQSLFTPDLICPLVGVGLALDALKEDPTASGKSVCEVTISRCENKFRTDPPHIPSSECPVKSKELAACKLPIGVVDECLNDTFNELTEQLSSITCDQVSKIKSIDELKPQFDLEPHTPACLRLATECPDDPALKN